MQLFDDDFQIKYFLLDVRIYVAKIVSFDRRATLPRVELLFVLVLTRLSNDCIVYWTILSAGDNLMYG